MKRTAREDLTHWEHLYKHRQYQEHFYPSYKYSSDELFNILNTVGDFKEVRAGAGTYLVVPSEVMRTALDILSMIVEESGE
jgi:hypothetical protein